LSENKLRAPKEIISESMENFIALNDNENLIKTIQENNSVKSDSKIEENISSENHYSIEDINNKNYDTLNEKLNNSNFGKISKYLDIRINKFKLTPSFCEKLKFICNKICKYSTKKIENFNYYEKGSQSIENYFNIVNLIKKFIKMSLIENCLLDEYQSKMIDVIGKPILSNFPNQEKSYTLSHILSENENNIKNYINDFLLKSNINNKIERNIFKFFDNFENNENLLID